MADITIASLKASLLEKQTLLTQKVNELNSANAELTTLSQIPQINDILVNNYTIAQYATAHPPNFPPGQNLWILNQDNVNKAVRAIQLKTVIIPKLNSEIANLKIEIDNLSVQIRDFQIQEVKTNISGAVKSLADGVTNNLPMVVVGIIVVGGFFYWLRNYFKRQKK